MVLKQVKPLPFRVDRNQAAPLEEQIQAGIVTAIRSGYYLPRERIPSIIQMAEGLGVSHLAVRRAIQRLSEAGEVVTRPHDGIRVIDSGKNPWKAHVLLLPFCMNTYYFSTLNHTLESDLNQAGIRTSFVMMHGTEYVQGFPHVREALDTQSIATGVILGNTERVKDEFLRRGIPFLCVDGQTERDAAAVLTMDDTSALAEMAAHCRASGVKTVSALFAYGLDRSPPVQRSLEAAGMSCRCLSGSPSVRVGGPEDVERGGYELTAEILRNRDSLPDLLYYSDDYLGRGGLTAILDAGVRVPEDLQVVIRTNKGHAPVFPRSLAQIEVDPQAQAHEMARLVQEVLLKPDLRLSRPVPVASKFIEGETTRLCTHAIAAAEEVPA